MEEFEIFWDDLTPECRKRLYVFLGNENGNYDVFPLATICSPKADDAQEQEDL